MTAGRLAPGTVAQVRESASRWSSSRRRPARRPCWSGTSPRTAGSPDPHLEHLVDVVLHFEGDGGPFRILRSHKNRFGSTQEIGVFEMTGSGRAKLESVPIVPLRARSALPGLWG